MPKQKTRKSLTRRFRITKNGKVLRGRAFNRHLKGPKTKRRIRRLRAKRQVTGFYAKKLKKAMGK